MDEPSELDSAHLGQTGELAINPPLDGFMRALIDTMPEGLVVIEPGGTIRAFSQAASALFGYSEQEALGWNVDILMSPEDAKRHNEAIKSYLATGRRKVLGRERIEHGRHKNGRTFPIKLTISEAVISGQRVFIGFIEDLTEANKQERKLRQLSSQLAHASRITSMSTLAGAIAHELNQPLSAIRNYVETVQDLARKDGPVDREMVSEAMSACSLEAFRAGEIIRRLREFIVRNDTAFTSESLSELIHSALALALADGEKSGVDVRLHLDDDTDDVLVDSVEIQQVIFNLARNALHAMAGRERKLIVICSRAQGEMVEVTVEDSGPGLDPEREAQLVLPFASGSRGGLGLGLQICQTIIEAHEGKIWSSPSELGGAAIHFTIPRMPNEGAPNA